MPYHTPNTPPDYFVFRRLRLPRQADWLALVNGALSSLLKDYNWEEYGDYPIADTVQFFHRMLLELGESDMWSIGDVVFSSNTSASPFRLLCDGSIYLRLDYPELYDYLSGSPFIVDADNFSVPDLRGRSPMGTGQGTGLTDRALGDEIGEENHNLTVGEMPSHTHTEGTTVTSLIFNGELVPAIVGRPVPSVTGSAGGGGSHNTIHPSLALVAYMVAR